MTACTNDLLSRFKALPEDVHGAISSLYIIPLLFGLILLAGMMSPIPVTPESLPGMFYPDGTLQYASLYKLTCMMAVMFFAFMRAGHDGSIGLCVAALIHAGVAHLLI